MTGANHARCEGGRPRIQILWQVHVWDRWKGEWRLWSGSSGDVRLDAAGRDLDSERHQRREAERISAGGTRVVKLTRLGSTIETYNADKLSRDEWRKATAE